MDQRFHGNVELSIHGGGGGGAPRINHPSVLTANPLAPAPRPVLAVDPDDGDNGVVEYRISPQNPFYTISSSTGKIRTTGVTLDRENGDPRNTLLMRTIVISARDDLHDAGAPGHVLQHAGLVAALQEDGSVVVDVQHLHEHGGRARPAAARRPVLSGRSGVCPACDRRAGAGPPPLPLPPPPPLPGPPTGLWASGGRRCCGGGGGRLKERLYERRSPREPQKKNPPPPPPSESWPPPPSESRPPPPRFEDRHTARKAATPASSAARPSTTMMVTPGSWASEGDALGVERERERVVVRPGRAGPCMVGVVGGVLPTTREEVLNPPGSLSASAAGDVSGSNRYVSWLRLSADCARTCTTSVPVARRLVAGGEERHGLVQLVEQRDVDGAEAAVERRRLVRGRHVHQSKVEDEGRRKEIKKGRKVQNSEELADSAVVGGVALIKDSSDLRGVHSAVFANACETASLRNPPNRLAFRNNNPSEELATLRLEAGPVRLGATVTRDP
ncbi:hypothetical protein CRUP_021207 [Coryphaenoides rupestris]|nr:hypothetical protein CRUP_021207 [Coryphaenoides rupestris]